MAEWQSITFVRYSEKLEPHNTRSLHIVFNPASAALNIQCALPASAPRLPTLRALVDGRSLLPVLSALHAELGDVFQLPMPHSSPVVLAAPQAARFLLVDARDDFRWRIESDPVARLFGHLVLASSSYLSGMPLEAYVGLGDAAIAEAVTVEWPDGRRTELRDVAADQFLRVAPPA